MMQLTDSQIERTIEACRQHLVEIGQTLQAALACEVRLAAGEASGIADSGGLAEFQTPGLVVAMAVGEQGLLVLIPQALPLPAWYRQPDVSQNNRLQTLAHELSLHVLPADLQTEHYAALSTDNLIEVAQGAEVASSARKLELSVFHADGTHEAAFAKILIVLPVNAPPIPGLAHASLGAGDVATESTEPGAVTDDIESAEGADLDSSTEGEETDASEVAAFDEGEPSELASAAASDATLRAMRVLNVPVTVSVRLAERKMSLGAVIALVPGSLVTFNKSCEGMLDLYVNNHRFCEGEAIKIGESFGLKIAKVGLGNDGKERVG
jgi:flagellar motor switch protein FliN/FliY